MKQYNCVYLFDIYGIFLSVFSFESKRHQYDSYKQQLLQCDGISLRDRSPRARRFFHHRRQPRDGDHGSRNDRGRRRRRPNESTTKESDGHEQNIEHSDNKPKSRRRFNRGRKSKKPLELSKSDDQPESLQLTASNLTTLLSELNMDSKPLNTAHSTSSGSLDFEKISRDDTSLCDPVLQSASSRLAATFNKGN